MNLGDYEKLFRKYLRSLEPECIDKFREDYFEHYATQEECDAENRSIFAEYIKMDLDGDGVVTDREKAQFDDSDVFRGGSNKRIYRKHR